MYSISSISSHLISSTGITENEAQEELEKAEGAAQKEKGMPPLHSTSASLFLAMGLELEESQYVYLLPTAPIN